MTIDSKYFPQRKTVYTGTFYAFRHESIGTDTIKVYRGDGDPLVWTLIDPADYVIDLGGEDPIYQRGTITFLDPIEPAALSIDRFTPRTQLLELNAGESFPSNAFEFSIDKMTLILQELEGSKCDCPNDNAVTPCDPAVIVTPPTNQEVADGADATFTVVATGDEPLTYQWYEDDVLMGGEESTTLVVTVTGANDGSVYKVVVTNECGTDEASATATLTGDVYKCDAYVTAISAVGAFAGLWEMNDKVTDPDWPAVLTATKGQDLSVNNGGTGITPETESIMADACASVTCMTIQQGVGAQGFNADVYATPGGMTISVVVLGSDGASDNAANISYRVNTGGAYQGLLTYDFTTERVGFQFPGNGTIPRTQWLPAPGLNDGEAHALTWFIAFALDSNNLAEAWMDHVSLGEITWDDTTTGVFLEGPHSMDLFDTVNTKAMNLAIGGKLEAPDIVILKDGWDRNKADYVP